MQLSQLVDLEDELVEELEGHLSAAVDQLQEHLLLGHQLLDLNKEVEKRSSTITTEVAMEEDMVMVEEQ